MRRADRPRERDVGGSARPTDQRVLHSSAPGWRTRRRVAAVAAPWNGLDGYAAAGLGPPAMDGGPMVLWFLTKRVG